MTEITHTFCHICEQCCGLSVSTENGRIVDIEPDKENPYSWRDFCVKGARALDVVYHPKRIISPMKRVDGRYVNATYTEAIDDIAKRLCSIIDESGPDAVAVYLGNPQAFSFSASTMMGAFTSGLKTHNTYYVGSVDNNAMHVVADRMYGSPVICLNYDVDPCKCFLIIGSNLAESAHGWQSHVADGWRRVLSAQKNGADVIVVDPRKTPTAAKADLHVAIVPGEDWALLLAVIKVIFDNEWLNEEDCRRCNGVQDLRDICAATEFDHLSNRCGVAVETIRDIARRFATAPAAHCLTRTGSGQTLDGTLAEWLGQALNVITGRMERPGERFFPRALVDIPGFLEGPFKPSTKPSRVRGLCPVLGHHSLAELADEILTPGPGQVRAAIIHGGNPVVSGPNGAKLDQALSKLDLLISIDLMQRESHQHAHWLIPSPHFLERTEFHPLLQSLHDRPFAQMSKAAVTQPEGIHPDWLFLTDLALKMRVPLFGFKIVNHFILATRLFAKLLKRKKLAFDPSWLAKLLVWRGGRVKWRDILSSEHGLIYGEQELGGLWRSLRTPDKRVNLCPSEFAEALRKKMHEASVLNESESEFPLRMITRRRVQNMNSWLAETTGVKARPCNSDVVEINEQDAKDLGIETGQRVQVKSKVGAIKLQAILSDRIRSGTIVVEHGWGSGLFDPSGRETTERYGVNRNLLVADDELDPFSGVPALNATKVCVQPL